MQNLVYITGTRADFGLMRRTLEGLDAHPKLSVSLCVTGMHLSEKFGHTVDEIRQTKLPIAVEIPVAMETGARLEMAAGFGDEMKGMAEYFAANKPDGILLLGDRGEMLAAAIVAAHLSIPVLHIGGGERSGTIDESIRHSITKFAHYHFTTTDACKQRVIDLGEEPETVYRVSAPGLDEIAAFTPAAKEDLCKAQGLDPQKPVAMCLFHPVVQTAEEAGNHMQQVLDAIIAQPGLQCLLLEPNADAGNQFIREAIKTAQSAHSARIKVVKHLPRADYLSWLAQCDVLIGNSSSGIIEAASFGTPVVNVGTRQAGRERNQNTYDTTAEKAAVSQTLQQALAHGRFDKQNIYGNGDCHLRLPEIVANISLSKTNFEKMNRY